MGRRRRLEYCFRCDEPVRSLSRHYIRRHGGLVELRPLSPPQPLRSLTTNVPPTRREDRSSSPPAKRLATQGDRAEQVLPPPRVGATTSASSSLSLASLPSHWVEAVTLLDPGETSRPARPTAGERAVQAAQSTTSESAQPTTSEPAQPTDERAAQAAQSMTSQSA